MWARVVEFMLACWLAITPFVFRYEAGVSLLWATDYLAAAAVATCSLVSFARRYRRAYLLNLVVGSGLIVSVVAFAPSPPPGAFQNHAMVGLLLLMLGAVPSNSHHMPDSWRDFYQAR